MSIQYPFAVVERVSVGERLLDRESVLYTYSLFQYGQLSTLGLFHS
jgi:hypothetical protein